MCVPNLPETIYQIRNKSGLGKARFALWRLFLVVFRFEGTISFSAGACIAMGGLGSVDDELALCL